MICLLNPFWRSGAPRGVSCLGPACCLTAATCVQPLPPRTLPHAVNLRRLARWCSRACLRSGPWPRTTARGAPRSSTTRCWTRRRGCVGARGRCGPGRSHAFDGRCRPRLGCPPARVSKALSRAAGMRGTLATHMSDTAGLWLTDRPAFQPHSNRRLARPWDSCPDSASEPCRCARRVRRLRHAPLAARRLLLGR